jgi:hypothetical protein
VQSKPLLMVAVTTRHRARWSEPTPERDLPHSILGAPAGPAVGIAGAVAVLSAHVDGHYASRDESRIRWNEPDIAFPWPLKGANILISDKVCRALTKDLPVHLAMTRIVAPLTVPDLG